MDRGPAGRSERATVAPASGDRLPPTVRHIGCPLWWFRLVFPVVRGKNELAVALYIYRLRIDPPQPHVAVSNTRLLAELRIDRFAKYRALRRLADAGIIKVKRHNKRALKITFCRKRGRSEMCLCAHAHPHVLRTHIPHVRARTSCGTLRNIRSTLLTLSYLLSTYSCLHI